MTGPTSREGTDFGRYRLRRLIGRGGMGEVYEAEDTEKDRIVALKLLPEGVSHDPVFRKRLQREAHSAGRLQEPHVVPIHDYGEIDGVLYVDMRMINGADLRKILKSYGPMTPARAVAIVRQIASALDAAHESGIMHRDVKPENILITRDDFAYLVDFGIANAASDEKLTELGTAVGTYAYMAPERFTSDQVTYRADVYALTCVLHECLTGSQPYPGDSVSMVITAHLMQPIPAPSQARPGIPAAFDRVVSRGMAKKPADRFASAGDLATAATDALSVRDQDQAAHIVQRGEDATRTGPRFGAPPPPPPYGAT
ncbi:MAG: serine/threonine protein kinase, partial [Mycolicibacterium sp.]|nr:serine/threonine protein kinase [Mycolicibacterium sp.]